MYKPEPLVPKRLSFSKELYAFAFDVEADFMRLDEASVHFPYASSLRHALVTLETLSTASISDSVPDLRVVIWMLGQEKYGSKKGASLPACLYCASNEELELARKAARYGKLVSKLLVAPMHKELRERDFLALHSFLSCGSTGSDMCYRTKPLAVRESGPWGLESSRGKEATSKKGDEKTERRNFQLYQAPPPQEVPGLMCDLFHYANAARQTPSIQAAVVHFQLQSIYPFDSTIDYAERLLSLAILRKRGVIQHLVPTIGYPLAANYDTYVHLLAPYLFAGATSAFHLDEALESWVRCCLEDLQKATQIVHSYMRLLRETVENYFELLGPCNAGSTIDTLVRELPGLPVLDTSIAMALTGKTFPAVSKAIDALVEKGILAQIGAGKRNRIYEATDILRIEQRIIDSSFGKSQV